MASDGAWMRRSQPNSFNCQLGRVDLGNPRLRCLQDVTRLYHRFRKLDEVADGWKGFRVKRGGTLNVNKDMKPTYLRNVSI